MILVATPVEIRAAIRRLQAVADAKSAGESWAQIGARQGVSGPVAKRAYKALEREAIRASLTAQARQPAA